MEAIKLKIKQNTPRGSINNESAKEENESKYHRNHLSPSFTQRKIKQVLKRKKGEVYGFGIRNISCFSVPIRNIGYYSVFFQPFGLFRTFPELPLHVAYHCLRKINSKLFITNNDNFFVNDEEILTYAKEIIQGFLETHIIFAIEMDSLHFMHCNT